MTTQGRGSLVAYAPLAEAGRAEVSVLVPARDEAENLPLFMELAAEAFAANPRSSYEVVVVDDGSVDDSWAVLQRLRRSIPSCAPSAIARRAASRTRSARDT